MATDCNTKKQETKQGRFLMIAIIGLTIVSVIIVGIHIYLWLLEKYRFIF